MKNIKHRKFTISSLTSLACFNVIRQKWAARGAFSGGSSSSCCRLTPPECCSAETLPGARRTRLLWSPLSSRAASQRGHCDGKHVPHPGLTDHAVHRGTSGAAKPHERRLLGATCPTEATDPAALMGKQRSYNSNTWQISTGSQQSTRSFVLMLSVDHFKLNLKSNTVR